MSRNLYFLSDDAYDSLWRSAVEARYINRGAASGKGISQYIEAASKCKFADCRPEDYRMSDAVRRSKNLTLYWSDGDTRKARLLTLDDETIERLCEIAAEFRIGIGKSHRTKCTYIRSTTVTIGKVLEAIGKRWLIAPGGVPAKKAKEGFSVK